MALVARKCSYRSMLVPGLVKSSSAGKSHGQPKYYGDNSEEVSEINKPGTDPGS